VPFTDKNAGDPANIDVQTSDESILDAADDTTLIAALLAHDSRAPRVLWRRFAPLVFRTLRRVLGRNPEVEDLAQEVFLCVFRKAPELREHRALPAFIISTSSLAARQAIRRSRHRVRVRARAAQVVRQPSAELNRLSSKADAREALVRFQAILERLKATDRTAFVLRFVEGMSLPDVATELGVSLATIKRRLARVRARVALRVEQDALLSQYRVGEGPARLDDARAKNPEIAASTPSQGSPPRPVGIEGYGPPFRSVAIGGRAL
jgi:RNA polymerase sigma-70 factor, ECF subfamily